MNKDSAFPSEVCHKRDLDYRRKLHRDKLKTARSSLDTGKPRTGGYRHVKNNWKRSQLQFERNAQIEHDNLLLVDKMRQILSKKQVNNVQTTIPRSLNREKRNSELTRIVVENERLLHRIIAKPPAYGEEFFESAEATQHRLVNHISRYEYQDPRFSPTNSHHKVGNYKVPIRPHSAFERPSPWPPPIDRPPTDIRGRPATARIPLRNGQQRPATARMPLRNGQQATARMPQSSQSSPRAKTEKVPIRVLKDAVCTISERECVVTVFERFNPHRVDLRAIDIQAGLEFALSLPFFQLRWFFKHYPDFFAGTFTSRQAMVKKLLQQLIFITKQGEGEVVEAQQLSADLTNPLERCAPPPYAKNLHPMLRPRSSPRGERDSPQQQQELGEGVVDESGGDGMSQQDVDAIVRIQAVQRGRLERRRLRRLKSKRAGEGDSEEGS